MNLDLGNKEWKEFLFIDIFDIKKGYYNKKPKSSNQGIIPFLSASQFNNGISEFYTISEIENASKTGDNKNDHPIEDKVFKGNCIAVTNNGSVGYAFYQKIDFTCSHDINPLYLKNYTLNSILAKFLITTIEAQRVCFEYARKWRPQRMVKSKILLPANSKGEPDYEFMEQYMRHKEQEKQKEYQTFIESRLQELKNTPKTISLEEKEWEEFFLNEMFTEIQRGKRLKKADHKNGNQPYISSTGLNNGLDGYVGNKERVRVFKNCITLANSGSVGSCFYQPYSFLASDHVTKLENKGFNKSINLFISSMVSRLGEKYSFNREINDTRIKREKIMLPITKSGKPDFAFMENYMKNLEYKKLSEYLEFKDK
jgi:hypothetical protein